MKDSIVRFILETEKGKKRLISLLVEHFFTSSILPTLRIRHYDDTGGENGWFHFVTPSDNMKYWGYLSCENPDAKNREISEILLGATGMPVVFFIYPEWEGNWSSRIRENFSTRIHHPQSPETDGNSREIENIREEFRNLGNRMESRFFENPEDTNQNGTEESGKWFAMLEEKELWKIAISRHLFNIVLGQKCIPVDIDAIFPLFRPESRSLLFVEFKRKDPARGYYRIPGFVESDGDNLTSRKIEELADIVNSRLDCTGALTREDVKKVLKDLEGEWEDEASFGLDMSHLKMFELCSGYGFHYCYIIWNQRVEKKKNINSELAYLFPEKSLNDPRRPFTLLSLILQSSNLAGISFTTGRDSGSWNRNLRLQAMIPVSCFRTLYHRTGEIP